MSPVESDEEDLTRKQRREQARSNRKEIEQAELAAAARRGRLMQLGVVVAVVVIAIVVVLVATGGKGKSGPVVEHGKNVTAEKVTKLLAGIPQTGNSIGKPTAPVTIQYYGDLECPFCKEFSTSALPEVITKWVRTGKARIEYKALETATREPETFRTQQIAALAAGKQSKAWNFIETFYNEQGEEDSGYVTESFLQGIAKQVPGLDLSKWTSDRGSSTFANELVSDAQSANTAGFNGTPSFLIGKTGGELKKLEVSSFTDTGPFDKAIEQLTAS